MLLNTEWAKLTSLNCLAWQSKIPTDDQCSDLIGLFTQVQFQEKSLQYKWKLTRRNNVYLCTATKVGNGLLSSSLSGSALARVKELSDATAIDCSFNLKPGPPVNAGLYVLTQALLQSFHLTSWAFSRIIFTERGDVCIYNYL